MTSWMTQEIASSTLGVRRQTLYAYVSRGLIQVRPDPTAPRRSLYAGDDIAALLHKRERGRTRDGIAASTMSWGEPIIITEISTIARGRLFYRGRDAVHLAATATLEEVAALLWDAGEAIRFPGQEPSSMPNLDHPRARAYAAMGVAAAEDTPAPALSPAMLKRQAASLVGRLAAALTGLPPGDAPLHIRLARQWGCDADAALLRRALVLLADQELTTSAFAARVTASTGTCLAAAALSGLAALSGPLHGDATLRVQALLEDTRRGGAMAVVKHRLAAGLALPGFGHPLYPEGDPRGSDLLDALVPSAAVRQLIDVVAQLTGLQPTIDVALAALVDRCRLMDGSAFALFAIGRSVGWMAHAIEHIATGNLLRPRARYVGKEIPSPEEFDHTSGNCSLRFSRQFG